MDVYKKLANDPAHKFWMETGIELTHKEPSLEELNRIMSNWLAMSDDMKKKSDKKSMELFKVNNIENYLRLKETY